MSTIDENEGQLEGLGLVLMALELMATGAEVFWTGLSARVLSTWSCRIRQSRRGVGDDKVIDAARRSGCRHTLRG